MTNVQSPSDQVKSAHEIIDRLSQDLDLSDELTRRARDSAEKAILMHPINRSPRVIAYSAIYMEGLGLNEEVEQTRLVWGNEISKQSIQQCYHEMLEYKDREAEHPHSDADLPADGSVATPSLKDRLAGIFAGGDSDE